MSTVRPVCAFAMLLIAVSPVFAAGGKTAKSDNNTGITYYNTVDKNLKPVTLTDDEKTKLDALKKEYEQKFKDAYAKEKVLTPEQVKAGDEARKTAKEAGKKGKELTAAVADAVKETDEQKTKHKEAAGALRTLETEFKGKVMDLLTADQKAQIDAAKGKKGKSKAAATK